MALLLFFPYLPYPNHHSGANTLIYRLLSELMQKEKTDLMVFTHPGTNQSDIDHIRKQVNHLYILPFPIPGQRRCLIRSIMKFPPVSKSITREINRLIRLGNYDSIVCASYLTSIIIHQIHHDHIISLPIDAFSRLHHQLSRTSSDWIGRIKHSLSVRLFCHFERNVFHLFKKTIVVSPHDCRYLNRLNRNLQCKSIPIGIDSERFRVSSEKREPMSLLFTGDFRYTPNRQAALFLLKEIMPRLTAEDNRIKLYLVGKNPSPEMLSYRSPSVIITGYVENIDSFYSSCQLFISPLFCGTGIKNKILEAAGSGMAVVASPRSLEGISIDRGIFQIAHNAAEFHQKALTLLKDPILCKKLGTAGRQQIIQRHNIKDISRRYVSLICPPLN